MILTFICFHVMLSRPEKVDDCLLLSPGHYSDTLESTLTWLKKSEVYLSDKQLILGDINTVGLLMDQHKVCYSLSLGFWLTWKYCILGVSFGFL